MSYLVVSNRSCMYVIDPENNVVTVTDPNHHHIYVNPF